MKMSMLIIPGLAALSLAACVSSGGGAAPQQGAPMNMAGNGSSAMPNNAPPAAMPNGAAHFDCQNGLGVNVRNLSNEQIEVRVDDKSAVLQRDVSGSGERYTSNNGLFGRGAEWHQKGNEAFFGFTDPYGNKVETTCNSGVMR
ncbi:MAG: MliC family protein [Cardiobacteriaceae bacterium]|nr:MliC family protein [Cardiobacteriaceae bacterium]